MARLVTAGVESVKRLEKSFRGQVATPVCLPLLEWALPGDGVTAHTLFLLWNVSPGTQSWLLVPEQQPRDGLYSIPCAGMLRGRAHFYAAWLGVLTAGRAHGCTAVDSLYGRGDFPVAVIRWSVCWERLAQSQEDLGISRVFEVVSLTDCLAAQLLCPPRNPAARLCRK